MLESSGQGQRDSDVCLNADIYGTSISRLANSEVGVFYRQCKREYEYPGDVILSFPSRSGRSLITIKRRPQAISALNKCKLAWFISIFPFSRQMISIWRDGIIGGENFDLQYAAPGPSGCPSEATAAQAEIAFVSSSDKCGESRTAAAVKSRTVFNPVQHLLYLIRFRILFVV
jgi:hypothetical protein